MIVETTVKNWICMKDSIVHIPLDQITLEGNLSLFPDTQAMVVFVHGSGSSRLSPRNLFVARQLQEAGFGTLLFDLLTETEDRVYASRFDIPLLTQRLIATTNWLREKPKLSKVKLGYFGASTGAAAALIAAAKLAKEIQAIVSRGGRPDLAEGYLEKVKAPSLLIVGGEDRDVIVLNQQALAKLQVIKKLVIVPGATHLFEELGKLEEVAQHTIKWFQKYLL